MKYFTLFSLLLPMFILGQTTTPKVASKHKPSPLFFVDNVKVLKGDFRKVDTKTVATVTFMNKETAQAVYGNEGSDGVVLVETKNFARKKYTNFFRQASAQYDSLYTKQGNDRTFQYILNGKVQKENFEGSLSHIDNKSLIRINILSNIQLRNKFGITGKQYGILIETKTENPDGSNKKR